MTDSDLQVLNENELLKLGDYLPMPYPQLNLTLFSMDKFKRQQISPDHCNGIAKMIETYIITTTATNQSSVDMKKQHKKIVSH